MPSYSTERDVKYKEAMERHLQDLAKIRPLSDLVNGFSKYVRRQELSRFLARHELFKKMQNVQGVIVE